MGSEITVPGTFSPGTRFRMRMQVAGTNPTTIRIKVWPVSQPEPSAWQLVTTDSEAVLQSGGGFGVHTLLSSSATNAPVTVSFENFEAKPANSVPTAAFQASCTSLTCSVDGSTSSDPDGPVTSYAWSFGDGTSATGARSSHTFAASGTYVITLTVTDERGATSYIARTVTV